MSVLIRGMQMPDKCLNCPMYNDYHCKIYSFGIPSRYNYENATRPEWCELVELPEHHSDLIDRKTLQDAVLKWMPPDPCGREEKEFPFEEDICVSMMMEIEEQEAIIEAEGG